MIKVAALFVSEPEQGFQFDLRSWMTDRIVRKTITAQSQRYFWEAISAWSAMSDVLLLSRAVRREKRKTFFFIVICIYCQRVAGEWLEPN